MWRTEADHAVQGEAVRAGVGLPGATRGGKRGIGVDQDYGFRETLTDRHAGILHHAASGGTVGAHDVDQGQVLKTERHLGANVDVA
jgi:hypothetical protein